MVGSQYCAMVRPVLCGALLLSLAGCGKPAPPSDPREAAMIAELRAPNQATQLHAIDMLVAAGSTRAVPALRALLLNIEPSVRAAAVRALGTLEGAKAAAEVIKALHDQAWEVRVAAATTLAQMGYREAVDEVAAGLTDEVAAVRRATADALAMMGADAQSRLLDAARQTNELVRADVMSALSAIDSGTARACLLDALGDSAAPVRAAAADALARSGDDNAVPNLLALLSDRDRTVRQAVQAGLVRFGTRVIPPVSELLKSGPPEARKGAVEILGRIGEPACMPGLLQGKLCGEPTAAANAGKYIALQLGSGRGVPAALGALGADDPAIAKTALRSLEEAGIAIPTKTLLDLLRGAHADMQRDAIRLLRGEDDERVVAELERIVRADANTLSVAAAVALAQIGNNGGCDLLLAALDAPTGNVDLADVVEALGALKEPRAFDTLLKLAVGSARVGVRSTPRLANAAICALGAIGDGRAVDPFTAELSRSLGAGSSRPHSDSRMEALAQSLGELRDPRAFDVLTRGADMFGFRMFDASRAVFLESLVKADPARAAPFLADYMARTDAVDHARFTRVSRLLGELGDPRGVAPVLRPLMSDISGVRQTAGNALVKMVTNGRGCAEELIRQMKQQSAALRAGIAAVLAEAGAPVHDLVVAGLSDPAPEVRQGCAWALGTGDDASVVAPLLKALADTDPHVRGAAAWALGRLRAEPAIEPLIGLTSAGDILVRVGAIDALAQLGDKRACAPLAALLDDTNQTVRASAVRALGILGNMSAVNASQRQHTDAEARPNGQERP